MLQYRPTFIHTHTFSCIYYNVENKKGSISISHSNDTQCARKSYQPHRTQLVAASVLYCSLAESRSWRLCCVCAGAHCPQYELYIYKIKENEIRNAQCSTLVYLFSDYDLNMYGTCRVCVVRRRCANTLYSSRFDNTHI